MQIMLHVPLVVDQVLYAYHKKRKAGTIPKNVLNCWIDLFFCFFFPFIWHFPVVGHSCICYRRTADSTGFQLTVKIHWQGKQFLWSWKLTQSCLLEIGWWRNISQKGSALFDSWELLPILPSLPSASPDWRRVFFTMIAKARASLWVEDLQKQLPWFSLVPSARSLGVCSISKLPWSAHTKGFVLAVSV